MRDLAQEIQKQWDAGWQGRNSCREANGNVDSYLNPDIQIKHGYKSQNKVLVNMLITTLERMDALMRDNPIDILVYPSLPKYEVDAMIYQYGINHIKKNALNDIVRSMLQKWLMLNGTGIIKIKLIEKGEGNYDIDFDCIDSRNVVGDPLATNLKNLKWVIEKCVYSKRALKELFPDYDINTSDDVVQQESDISSQRNQYNESVEDELDKEVVVYERWTPTRRTVTCGNQTLHDDDHDYEGIPYVIGPCLSVPDRMYGIDWISRTRKILDEINYCIKRFGALLKKTANPYIVVNTDLIDKNKMTNEDGLMVEVSQLAEGQTLDSAIRWVYPPAISPQFIQYFEILLRMFADFTSTYDAAKGNAVINSGVPSGISIEKLQEAAQVIVRNMATNMKLYIYPELGKKLSRLIKKYFNVDKLVRITGEDAAVIEEILDRDLKRAEQELFKVARTEEEIRTGIQQYKADQAEKYKIVRSKNSVYLQYNGSMLEDPNEFIIDVKAGMDVPKSKVDVASQALQLFMANPPRIDFQSYLEMTDNPNKDKLLERDQKYQQMLQFQQMMTDPRFQQAMQIAMQAMTQQPAQQPVMPGQPAGQVPENTQVA